MRNLKTVLAVFNESWILMADVSHTILDDNITASPLVGSDSQSSVAAMIMYQF